jgi:hypothetical protein
MTAARPEIVYLGTTEGQWPVSAFGSESLAKHWAAAQTEDGTRRYLWPVLGLQLGEPLKARVVPASVELDPARAQGPSP